MVDTNKLRGAIYTEYKSISQLCDVVKWPKHKFTRLLQGAQIPDANDISVLRKALKLSPSEIIDIFFAE